jgi:flagellar hook-associated protein 2
MSSPIRMTGMATGLDTDALVKQMMQAKKIPVDRMKQQQTSLTWQRDAYRDMNTLMSQLRDAANNLRLESYMNPKKVTTDNAMVTATAAADANKGVYALTVHQMATAASITSSPLSSATAPLNSSDTVLNINGTDITFTANSTANDVVSAINAKTADTGVKASFDAVTRKLTFNSNKTGSTSKIDIAFTSGDGSMISNLNLPTTSATGNQAIVDYNGSTGLTFDTNNFTVDKISFQLKPSLGATFPANVNVAVDSDTDKAFNNVKAFVEKYNEVVEKVYDKTHEAKYRDYQPLTEDQRTNMKDDQIKLWEDKAKSGLLRNDATLTGALDSFRNDLMNPVTGLPAGNYDSLSDIGITTSQPGTTNAFMEHGKLYLDEDKLKNALASNPEQVSDLFVNGFGERIYQDANTTMTRLTKQAGSAATLTDNSILSVRLRDLNDDITDATSKLSDYENQYYKQFAALETAMNKMNSQSAWMSQQFSSMGGQGA